MNKKRLSIYVMALLAVSLAVSMVLYPEEAFTAAVDGLQIWWNVVFPALLPFFIGSELLMGFGVVHFLGVLLEPLMRPLFKVPGEGSFVLAMGLASGFPIGAILSARLRREGIFNKIEAERLMSFTNTADPLFMAGAVAVGMFGYPEIGATIATAHYLSSFSTGLVMRFYGKDQSTVTAEKRQRRRMLPRAINALYEARIKDGRALGQIMGDAVLNSVNSLLLVGGFIILFSVIIRVLTVIGAVSVLSTFIYKLLAPLGLDANLMPAIISGIFEIDLGCQVASEVAANAPMLQTFMVVSGIIAWSGLSVHGQVASIISDTDMNITPFIIARVIQTIFAAIFTWLLIGPLASVMAITTPVFAPLQQGADINVLQKTMLMSKHFIIFAGILLLLGILINLYRGIKITFFRA
ncbi:MAG: sporulation integral membrane protein YlbJ [Firmicutes bacterium]|mgnify:CR=1 FL=1|nr:sporulation integral membrane protein YlbJ [Bacillota bacterium]